MKYQYTSLNTTDDADDNDDNGIENFILPKGVSKATFYYQMSPHYKGLSKAFRSASNNKLSTATFLRVSLFLSFVALVLTLSFTLPKWIQNANADEEVTNKFTIFSEYNFNFSISHHPYPRLSSLAYLPWYGVAEPFRTMRANITSVRLGDEFHDYKRNSERANANKILMVEWVIDGSSIAIMFYKQ